jgi:AraC-like DNA-binding protein
MSISGSIGGYPWTNEAGEAGNPGGRIYAETLGAAPKAHFVHKHAVFGSGRLPTRGDVARNRMAAVLDYISAHLDKPISLMDLAAVADVGVFHFAHAFRRRMGMPPHQYVLRRRVERAILLMRDPKESLVDIALLRVQQPESPGDCLSKRHRNDSRCLSGPDRHSRRATAVTLE